MADETLLTGDCKERVAFDLMVRIANEDLKGAEGRTKDLRNYHLALFKQCLDAVNGGGYVDEAYEALNDPVPEINHPEVIRNPKA